MVGSDAVDVGFHLNGFSEGSTVRRFASPIAWLTPINAGNTTMKIQCLDLQIVILVKKEVTIKATSFPMEEKFIFY